ncbi:solute carrier family 35 member G1-like isoform X1 [Ptychodera flava]|uniref:solute carrier family 35 member G1-like isoform X1 n=1 Tax=Ptychodera flava TaxID=63121 RepID=UPI00396A02AA
MKGDKRQLLDGVSPATNGVISGDHGSQDSKDTCWDSTKRIMLSGYGVALGLLSGLSFATCSIFIHLIGYDVPALQINFISVFAIGLVVVPPMLFYRVKLKLESVKDFGLIVGKGIGYTLGMVGDVVALTLISTGNVTAITNGLLPVFTAIFACVALREMLRLKDGITIVLNVSGVLMITQPTFIFGDGNGDDHDGDDDDVEEESRRILLGNIMAVASAVGFAIAYVVARGLEERVHVLTSLFYDAIIASFISLIAMYLFGEVDWDMDSETIGRFVGVAISTAFAQWASYRCLQLQAASTATLLFNVEVVAAYFLEYIIVDRVPTLWEIFGACLVLFSSGFVAVLTWHMNLKERKKQEAEGYLEIQ